MAAVVNKHVFSRILKSRQFFMTGRFLPKSFVRTYAKGLKRTPIRVYTAEQAEEIQVSRRSWAEKPKRQQEESFGLSDNDIPDDINFKREKKKHIKQSSNKYKNQARQTLNLEQNAKTRKPVGNHVPWSERRAIQERAHENVERKKHNKMGEKGLSAERKTDHDHEVVLDQDSFGWMDSGTTDNIDTPQDDNKQRIRITNVFGASQEENSEGWNESTSDDDISLSDDSSFVPIDTDHSPSKSLVKPTYPYIRLEEGDKRFPSAVIKAKGSQGKREKHGTILLEGHKLINDAFEGGVEITTVFFDTVTTLNKLRMGSESGIKFFKVRTSTIKTFSDMHTPPGVMAIAKTPKFDVRKGNASPLILILDNIRDPGDMGTLLRTACVSGCQHVIAMKGCIDVWNSKVLRAAAGSHFRMPIVNNILWQHVGSYLPNKTYISLTQHYRRKLNRELKNFQDIAESSAFYDEQDKYVHVDQEDGDTRTTDHSFSRENVEKYRKIPLPRLSLFDMDIGTHDHVTCIVSGQGEGSSGAAKKMVFENGGEEVYIPNADEMIPNTNTSVAGCIVLMEAKRQLYKKGLVTDIQQSVVGTDASCDYERVDDDVSNVNALN